VYYDHSVVVLCKYTSYTVTSYCLSSCRHTSTSCSFDPGERTCRSNSARTYPGWYLQELWVRRYCCPCITSSFVCTHDV